MKFILVIWHEIYDREITFPNIQRHYDTPEEAIEYAETWLDQYHEDIVMLHVIRVDVCKHCDKPIQEVPGAIIHKWAHQGSITRVCFTRDLTQAEPKGVAG